MNETTPFDEFRALLDGRLDAEATARLRGRIAADAALAAEFAAYSEVHAFTAAALVPAPASRATFERLDAARRGARMRRLRPWIAAAAGLLVATGAAAAYRAATATSDEPIVAKPQRPDAPTPRAPRPVVLKTIRLADAVAAADATPLPEPPAALEDFRPVEKSAIRWIASVDGAYAMAKWSGRPVLVWVCMEGCPVCADLAHRAFVDRGVTEATGRFVPLRIDWNSASAEMKKRGQDAAMSGQWPYMAAYSPERKEVKAFSGSVEPEDLRRGIDSSWTAFAAAPQASSPPTWDVVNELVVKLPQAAEAWKAGRVAEAWTAWDDAARRGGATPLGDVGRAGVRRVAGAAAKALEEARGDASTPEAAGARRLSEAAERFRGTPYGTDLAEVEKELRATGRFPTIEEAAH